MSRKISHWITSVNQNQDMWTRLNVFKLCYVSFTVFTFFFRIPIDDVLVNFEEIQLIHLQPDAITQGVALEEVRNC